MISISDIKTALGITGEYNDLVLFQKLFAVKNYMRNAGVSDENIESDVGIACVCVGVTDLWNLSPGEIQFSPAFSMMVEQLVVKSLP